jgi:hypothetical protein
MVPVQVPFVGVWVSESQVRTAGPFVGWAPHSTAALRQAREPLQLAWPAETSAFR